jgi:gliding motility-associated-like protein
MHNNSIYATVKNAYNCISKDTVTIKVFEPFTAIANPDKVYVCEDKNTSLQVGPTDKKVIWSPAIELDNPTIYSPLVTPTVSRVYTATLTDSMGCFSSTKDVTVTIKSNPEIDLAATKFLPFNSNYTITPVYTNNITNVLWSPSTGLSCDNCLYPQTVIDEKKTFTVTATSDSGCVVSKTITLVIDCNNAYLMMPSAFTPNNDGTNDIYYPLSFGIKHIKRFAIFNRVGELLYENRNFSPNERTFGWNGKFKNVEQPVGTYIYVIEANCELGQTTSKKGSFILFR